MDVLQNYSKRTVKQLKKHLSEQLNYQKVTMWFWAISLMKFIIFQLELAQVYFTY